MKTDLRSLPISFSKLKMARHVLTKLCFLMDCTGSMGPWIDAAKTKIQEMTDKVIADNPGTLVEVALVGYRDYGDTQRFHVVDFTEPENVMRELRLIRADGGDDEAEDVVGGLMRVLRLSWDGADVQMVVHIADAPAHGLQYHPPISPIGSQREIQVDGARLSSSTACRWEACTTRL